MTEPIIFRIWITGMSVVAMPWIEATQGQAPTSSAYVTTIDDRESVEDALKIFRAPLLREGSNLVQVKSTVSRDASTGEWKLLVDTANPGNADVPRYELIVLPCSRLAEMQRIIESHFRSAARCWCFEAETISCPRIRRC